MIFSDFAKALGQLGDPRFRGVLLRGVGLTLLLLIGFLWGFYALVGGLTAGGVSLPYFGTVAWLGQIMAYGSVAIAFVLSSFVIVPVASTFTSIFLDDVAQAVENKHYPNLPVPPRVPLSDALRDTFGFLGVLLAANLIALMLSLLLPFLGPFIFYGVNGYLLGREYFQLAAMRREGRAGAKEMRARHAGAIWVAGILMALPLSIPVINLLVPVLGAATFTHLYHRLSGR